MKLKEGEVLQVKSDTLMHDLLNSSDMNAIEWVVMQILECSYEEIHGKVSVGNIRLTRTNKKEKNKYLDLIVEYKDEKIILELNNNYSGFYTRNILYATNVLLNNYQISDERSISDYYQKIVRVILVNLNWFKSKTNGKTIRGKQIYSIPYSDLEPDGYLLKIINVNLDYFDKLCYDDVSESDKLYKLLTIKSKKELMEIRKKEKLLEYYSDKLIDLSSNEKYNEVVMDKRVEKNIEKQTAYLVGKNDGIEEGIEQNQKEMIKKMLDEKISLETISRCVGLTVKEIKSMVL